MNTYYSFDRYPYLRHNPSPPPKPKKSFREWLADYYPISQRPDNWENSAFVSALFAAWNAAKENSL